MKLRIVVTTMVVALLLMGCASGPVNAPPAGGQAGGQSKSSAEQTAQQAVDAVFTKVSGDATFSTFPRTIGTAPGVVGIGGPSPGVTIPATFETKAEALGGGQFKVELIRRWGPGPNTNTTWNFLVDAKGAIEEQGRTGENPPTIP